MSISFYEKKSQLYKSISSPTIWPAFCTPMTVVQYILSTSHAKDKLSAMEDEMSHTSSNIHLEEE